MIAPRPVTRADLGEAVRLLGALNARGERLEPRYRLRVDAPERLRELMRDAWFGTFLPFPTCWVVGDEPLIGLISGTIMQDHPVLDRPHTVRIDNLFVVPEHRGQGHGRRLVEAFCRAAHRSGTPRIDVGTLSADAGALSFWRAIGFADLRVTLSSLRDPAAEHP